MSYLNTTHRMEVAELNDWARGFMLNGTNAVDESSVVYTMADIEARLESLGGFVATVNDTILTILLLVYMLSAKAPADTEPPSSVHHMTLNEKINAQLSFYIVIKTQISLCTGALIGIGLYVCQVRLAILWGILAFVLNYIPNVGSVIAMILPIPMVYIDDNLSTMGKTAGECDSILPAVPRPAELSHASEFLAKRMTKRIVAAPQRCACR